MELAHTDLVLADVGGREHRLRDSLAPIAPNYDFILCDCAPSLSMLPVNTLMAADGYLVPLSPEHLAFEGLTSLLEAVHLIEEGMDVELRMLGIVLTMVTQARFPSFHPEVRDQRKIIERVQARYGTDVFRTMISRDPAIARAPASALTVGEAAPKSRGARDFSALALEFLDRTATPSQMNQSNKTPHSTNMPFGEDDR